MRNHYASLGVPPDADRGRIKRAYRALARRVHPDVNRSPNAAAEFRALTEAYEILRDSARRRAYDRELEAARLRRRTGTRAAAAPPPPPPPPPPRPRPPAADLYDPEFPPERPWRPGRPRADSPPGGQGRGGDPWGLPGKIRVPGVWPEWSLPFGCGALMGAVLGGFQAAQFADGNPLTIAVHAVGAAVVGGALLVFRWWWWRWRRW